MDLNSRFAKEEAAERAAAHQAHAEHIETLKAKYNKRYEFWPLTYEDKFTARDYNETLCLQYPYTFWGDPEGYRNHGLPNKLYMARLDKHNKF